MDMTSRPLKRLSLGTHRLHFVAYEDGRIERESEVFHVLAFQMKRNGRAQILGHLVERSALRDHGEINTLGDEAGLFAPDDDEEVIQFRPSKPGGPAQGLLRTQQSSSA